jgi:hypothetical protein
VSTFSLQNQPITHTHTNYFDSVVKEPGPFRPVEPANSTAFQNQVKKNFQNFAVLCESLLLIAVRFFSQFNELVKLTQGFL